MKRLISWFEIQVLKKKSCTCMKPPFSFKDQEVIFTGYDNKHYGEMKIFNCKNCSSHWLIYEIQFESRTGSGRWFSCLIPPLELSVIKPENAVTYLSKRSWYFYGGDYYFGKVGIGTGQPNIRP